MPVIKDAASGPLARSGVPSLLSGMSRLVVLKRLKISNLIWAFSRSVIGVVLNTPRSTEVKWGP